MVNSGHSSATFPSADNCVNAVLDKNIKKYGGNFFENSLRKVSLLLDCRLCTDMLRNISIRQASQNLFITAQPTRKSDNPIPISFSKRENFDGTQKFNLRPVCTGDGSSFYLESAKIPGYFLQVIENEELAVFSNNFQTWSYKEKN